MQTIQPDYKINLEMFEGPLDLLLHLIKKNDLSIQDIQIALILDQYVEYIELMKELNIDVAGEFIYMASELAHIKSRILLYESKDAEDEEPDPRQDLMARLFEYQKYKNGASWLIGRPLLSRDVFKRPPEKRPDDLDSEQELLEIEPFALLASFGKILKRVSQGTKHEIEAERISITERIYQLVELFRCEESILFEDLFKDDMSRGSLVVTFLAMLEMARLKMIQVYQFEECGSIRIRKRMEISGDDSLIPLVPS